MKKSIGVSMEHCGEEALAVEAAEAEFILAVQCEIQKLLNQKGLRARDLSRRLNVTEARISQMFSDQAKNLTLRTIAKIFFHLGETAYITTHEEYDRSIAAATGQTDDVSNHWTVRGLLEDIEVAANSSVERTSAVVVALEPAFIGGWARAEKAEALKPHRLVAAR